MLVFCLTHGTLVKTGKSRKHTDGFRLVTGESDRNAAGISISPARAAVLSSRSRGYIAASLSYRSQ